MSILKNLETYEKMLQDPKNRVSSSGKIKQPAPTVSELNGVAAGKKLDTSNLPEESNRQGNLEDISEEEQSYLSAIDKRMALRREGKLPDISSKDDRILKLEKQVNEIQELLIEVMKTHMKLLDKIQ